MRNFVFNRSIKLRRETIIKLAKLYETGKLKWELPKLNKTILPGPTAQYRTSVYHEREVLKHRIKLYLGLDYEKTKNLELFEIANSIDQYLSDESYAPKEKFVQVIQEACDICPSGKYYATDLCRNCMANSCRSVCPRNAIEIKNGRAVIDTEKCVGCGLCEKACNYFAIVKLERPCERSCAVSAIKSNGDSAVEINYEDCLSCGSCFVACPFGAVETPSDIIKVMKGIKSSEDEMIAMFAPAIIAQFGPKVTLGKIKTTLKMVGFSEVYEVALGADIVAEEEAEFIENSTDTVTTSCCPAFVDYIEKNQPDFIDKISPAPSPMIALAEQIKKEKPDAKIVFIGPCIAKKMEAYNKGFVKHVLTFEEIAALFIAKNIEPSECESEDIEGSVDAWNFASSGGVTQAVVNLCKKDISTIKMDGLDQANQIFQKAKKEKFDLIEGMACEGGCISGPCIMSKPVIAKSMLSKLNF